MIPTNTVMPITLYDYFLLLLILEGVGASCKSFRYIVVLSVGVSNPDCSPGTVM